MLFGKDSFRKKNIGKYIIGYELGKGYVQISYLKIGDKEEKISQLMGENYTKDGEAYNYVDGNTLLQIIVNDGAIKSIEYKPAN